MANECTLQLHQHGAWHDIASVSLFGPEQDGWRARCYAAYAVPWSFSHGAKTDAHAVCANWPVGLEPLESPHWPVFLMDLLPQGFGRQELLRRIGLAPGSGVAADWRLLLVGAGNPIGNLRVKEAAQWLAAHAGPQRGFSDADVAQRGDEFAEHLAAHGLFVAGSSGVQGEWPKILLTRGSDGLLYLDHTLPDTDAREHYIVKFSRGPDPQLAAILRHEAPYMALARQLGLRVHAPLTFRDRALFIPRFDRVATSAGVTRLAQESIATLTGMPSVDAVPSHDQVCLALMRYCTDPEAEVIEYLRRDVANLALLNKDNHARNTAVQRDFAGRISLTPLFDFAPMYLHPEGIARRIRWEGNDDGRPDWRRVIDRLVELSAQDGRHCIAREPLVLALKAMVPVLSHIAKDGEALGLDPAVVAHLRPHILAQAQQLTALD